MPNIPSHPPKARISSGKSFSVNRPRKSLASFYEYAQTLSLLSSSLTVIVYELVEQTA